MKSIRERVYDLSEEQLKSLREAVNKFDCFSLYCSDCPFCGSDGVCIGRMASEKLREIYRNR